MIASGSRFATLDRAEAEALLAQRLAELERAKRRNPEPHDHGNSAVAGERRVDTTFAGFAPYALDVYEGRGKVTSRHLKDLRHRAEVFARFIGPHARLEDVDEMRVHEYLAQLSTAGLSEASQRHYLNAISLVYRLAGASGLVPKRFNPVRDMEDKPQPSAGGTAFLEVPEAAVLLDTALVMAEAMGGGFRVGAVALACGLLTGGRRREVMGLLVDDVNFDAEVVNFEPRTDRQLKNRGSSRTVPLWPQLAAILRQHLNQREGAIIAGIQRPSGFLFPTPAGDTFVQDPGKTFARIIATAGLESRFKNESWRVLRRTYATARLQTTDGGRPVAEYVVERELGHGTGAMLRRVYGKVGRNRHRSEVVEFRTDQYQEALAEALRSRDRRLHRLLSTRSAAVPSLPGSENATTGEKPAIA